MSVPQLPGELGAARLTHLTSLPLQQGEGEWVWQVEGVALKGTVAVE